MEMSDVFCVCIVQVSNYVMLSPDEVSIWRCVIFCVCIVHVSNYVMLSPDKVSRWRCLLFFVYVLCRSATV